MKSLIAKFLLPVVAAVGLAVPAFAGENSGSIQNTYLFATSGSRDFQITLTGLSTLCPGHNFAYINQTDPNYTAITKNITDARGFGSTVYVFWVVDGSGYCHITEVYY
jgi:hypothetical protein